MKYYTPRQLAKLGLIPVYGRNTESSNYQYIMMLIRMGRLKAYKMNPDSKVKPHYVVTDKDLKKYLRNPLQSA